MYSGSTVGAHTYQLPIMQVMQVIIDTGNEKVMINQIQNIVNDGTGGNLSFVISIVVEKPVQ